MNVPGASVGRGLVSRAGSTAMIFIVAVVAVAAAAAGPTYFSAAQTSIVRDTLETTQPLGRGFGVTQSGPVSGTIDAFSAEVAGALGAGLGPAQAKNASRLFQPQIEAIETTAYDSTIQTVIPLVWRTDVCAHVLLRGSCPSATGQVIASTSFMQAFGFHVGERVRVPTWGTLTIVGVYTAPSGGDYWFDRLGTYFPAEFPAGGPASSRGTVPSVDAFFTPRATIEAAPSTAQGTDVIDDLLATDSLRPPDIKLVGAAANNLLGNPELQATNAVATTDIPQTSSSITSAWSSLAVPVVLISAELLFLAWLLLLLLVTEEAEARGSEVALAKLRGHGRLRTLAFGLSEPLVLLALALPIGALAGWGATVLISHDLLRPGTPITLPGLSWAAAGAAVLGGLVAVVVASRRMLGRPVVEQWRRASRSAAERGWVIDGILLSAAAFGLLDLLATGTVSSAHKNALALLVPGLLGLAVAVVASRLLPLMCRGLTASGRTVGGLGTYLALRHVARRPGGARTTIMLAASFSLATFALAAWTVNDHNDTILAAAQVGAPTVLDVATPPGTNLSSLVAQADPGGREAAPVIEYEGNQTLTMAVDPARWSRIATWPGAHPSNLPEILAPPAPAPIALDGSAVRVSMSVGSVSPPRSTLILDVDSATGTATTPLQLGTPPQSGPFVATAALSGCPCMLQDLTVQPPPMGFQGGPPAHGTIVLHDIEVATGDTRWSPASDALDDPARWHAPGTPGSVTSSARGLVWSFRPTTGGASAVLAPLDRPTPLPAVAATAVTNGATGPTTFTGVDGYDLATDVKAVVPAIPGAPSTGVLVDLDYAERAANGFVADTAIEQVWVAGGAGTTIAQRLSHLGVTIVSTTSQSGTKAFLGRQGPGLARVLFLAEAGAAAALAAGGAILGLYLFARRRRYEYAALAVSGLRTRTLLGSLMAEQLIVVVFGLIVGIGAGLASVAVALRAVPEFLTVPTAPALSYLPPTGQLVEFLAVIVAVVIAASLLASIALIRSVRLDQLREAPT